MARLTSCATAIAAMLAVATASASEDIGVATMLPDRSIEVRLIYRGPGGIVGHGRITRQPDDKDYRMLLDHIGGLQPGESKSVPPWPETPAQRP